MTRQPVFCSKGHRIGYTSPNGGVVFNEEFTRRQALNGSSWEWSEQDDGTGKGNKVLIGIPKKNTDTPKKEETTDFPIAGDYVEKSSRPDLEQFSISEVLSPNLRRNRRFIR